MGSATGHDAGAESLAKGIIEAAKAYVARCGMTVVSDAGPSTFTAYDVDCVPLYVYVVQREEGDGRDIMLAVPRRMQEIASNMDMRLDVIEMRMLDDSRALLRHHRDVNV